MKLKYIICLLVVSILYLPTFSQSNSNDSLKTFTIKLIERAIKKSKIKKIAVWDFTDINKENTIFGSHIAELISVYATYVDSVIVMDRQNLKSLLKEHKLKSEGFIDQNTIMELGKFSGVDAVIVGDAIVTGKDFEVVIKILETNRAGIIAADDQYFPIDSKMAAKLGIQISESNNSSNANSPNRGFNRPLNSNEQYNNSATVNSECEKKNTGDYCFYNGYKKQITLNFNYYTVYEIGGEPRPVQTEIILKPGESKCIYNVYVSYTGKFTAVEIDDPNTKEYENPKTIDMGDFISEKCKSKTYSIK